MTSPPLPPPHSSGEDSAQDALAQAFEETQSRLQAWQESYHQIQATQAKLSQSQSQGLDAEVQRLQQQLKELELDLALTIVLSLGDAAKDYWQDILKQESFWQFLRFAGIGFVLGLVVKALIG
ncbi:hypothetical protein [Synechococcus sp. PCC 6312]|uniref:hypothetical protein n=1 Tax=Synechococcus sp. (strain ATCC 27167 / PCC 6312) TaxID=195253 RepID=UPI00029F4C78|nr:hypothetical protein [Synechococcus sp. PCC 6312]AFY60176.1 hypothetical protein Syn6312_0976 [Synechococcus sp. PCC 6312]